MKARPSKTKGKKLHIPPPEFARAEKEHHYGYFQDAMDRYRAKIEAGRSVKMPSKRPPSSRFVYGRDWKGCPVAMESKEAFARRVARWFKRHGKKGNS